MVEQMMQGNASEIAATQTIPAGYKQTDVGVIPEDWEVVCLGDIGQSLIGLTYSPKDVSDDGVLVLRSSNVQNGRLAYEDSVFVKMELPDRVIVKDGDILICVRNGSRQLIGKCALIDKSAQGFAFGAFMTVYRTKASGFVFYQFQSDVIQSQINETMGATINQITNRDLSGFKIMIPNSILEQTTIANVLSDTDALIGALEQLIAKKQAIKTASMQQLLTGRTRLQQFALRPDGTPKGYKPSELGDIPEDWEVDTIGKVCDLLTGYPFPSNKYSDSGVRLLRGSNVKRGITDWSSDITQYWPTLSQEIKQYELLVGDIVISMDGSLVGRSFAQLTENDLPALLLQRVARIRSVQVSQYFLKEWICSPFFTEHCDSVKTVTAIPHISPQDIRDFKFLLPPTMQEQTAIATILSDMDSELNALEQKLAKARDVKQGIMQQLLTGRIRLPLEVQA